MSIRDLDPVIHAPKRLGAMAILANTSSTDFGFLRDHLDLSDSDLSKQMTALQDAGYISVHKSGRGRGGTTTYSITSAGRDAYRSHVAALQAITAPAGAPPSSPDPS